MHSDTELVHKYLQEAKEIAKVEKSLSIERWVKITIYKDCNDVLHQYDLPRNMQERWEWVIFWRRAKFQCLYPRNRITLGFSHYRKVMGVTLKMQDDINTFVAAKAQVTRQERLLKEYVEFRRKDRDLFYDIKKDFKFQKIKQKLSEKKDQVEKAEARLINKVLEWKKNNENGKITIGETKKD